MGLACLGFGVYTFFGKSETTLVQPLTPPKIVQEQPQNNKPTYQRLQVPANVEWYDTGIDIADKVKIEYEAGEWRNHPTRLFF